MNLIIKRIKLIHKDAEYLPVILDASIVKRMDALITNGNWTVNLSMNDFPKQEQPVQTSWVRFSFPASALEPQLAHDPLAVLCAKLDYTSIELEDDLGPAATFELPWLGDGNVNKGISIQKNEADFIFEAGFHII